MRSTGIPNHSWELFRCCDFLESTEARGRRQDFLATGATMAYAQEGLVNFHMHRVLQTSIRSLNGDGLPCIPNKWTPRSHENRVPLGLLHSYEDSWTVLPARFDGPDTYRDNLQNK